MIATAKEFIPEPVRQAAKRIRKAISANVKDFFSSSLDGGKRETTPSQEPEFCFLVHESAELNRSCTWYDIHFWNNTNYPVRLLSLQREVSVNTSREVDLRRSFHPVLEVPPRTCALVLQRQKAARGLEHRLNIRFNVNEELHEETAHLHLFGLGTDHSEPAPAHLLDAKTWIIRFGESQRRST